MPNKNAPLILPNGTARTTGLKVGDVIAAILARDSAGFATLTLVTKNGPIDIPATSENIKYLSSMGIDPYVPELIRPAAPDSIVSSVMGF